MMIDFRNGDVQDGDGNESIDAKVCEASVLSFVFWELQWCTIQ